MSTQPARAGWSTGNTALEGSRSHKWWTLAATCVALFMALLDVTIVNVALPTIQKDLGASFQDLQWVVSAYTLTLASFLVTSGRLGDIFGRKRVFIIGLIVFTFGSLLCAISGNVTIGGVHPITLLHISRAIQGIGGSIMFPLTLAIISATFEGRERGAAIGIWGGVTGLATAIGPLIGGLLVEKINWQSIFYLNIPIGVAAVALTTWAVRESRDEHAARSVDLFGLVTVTVSMFCLLLALIQGNDADKGWTSPYILTLFAVAALAFLTFIIGELRLKNPMVDPRLFKNASFTGAAIAGFSVSAGMFSLFFFLALYFQNFLGFAPLDAGLRFLPLSCLAFFAAPIAGRMTDKIGARPFVFGGLALLAIAAALMTRISPHDQQNDWVVLLPAFLIGGIGIGLVNPPISTVAVGTVQRARAGMASGVNGMCRQVGNAFGIAFLGAMLTRQYNAYLHDRITALTLPGGMPDAARTGMIGGLQKAGTIAGSMGRISDPAHPNPYQGTPAYTQLAPQLRQIARASFVDGTVDILRIAAVILAVGAVASLLLIKRSDMLHEQWGAAPAGASAEVPTRQPLHAEI